MTDDHAATPSDNAAEVENGSQSRRLVLAVMCVGYFLVLLDVTIVNVALPSIGDDLNASVWRWVFAINAPIVLIAGIVTIRRVENDRNRGERRVDAPGTALGALLLAAGTFAVIQAGHSGPNVAVVLSVIVALLAGVAFWRVELRAKDPMLPLALFVVQHSRPPMASPPA